MKSRILIVCLIISIIIGVIIYSVFQKHPVAIAENVTMLVENITPTGATMIITDLSGKDHLYNECYSIEKYNNDIWQNIAKESNTCNMVGVKSSNSNQIIWNLDWTDRYGPLDSGKYRIVKVESFGNIYGEFIID